MARSRKEYNIKEVVGDTVSIEEYRKDPWAQKWGKTTFDFRRWLYVGRPILDKEGQGEGLIHAGRDDLVATLCKAVWDMTGVADSTKKGCCRDGLINFFEFLDCRQEIKPVTTLTQIDKVVIEEYIYWLRYIKKAETETGNLRRASVKNAYSKTKSVLLHLVHQQTLPLDIFPANPFPNINRDINHHRPYPKQIMRELLKALGSVHPERMIFL